MHQINLEQITTNLAYKKISKYKINQLCHVKKNLKDNSKADLKTDLKTNLAHSGFTHSGFKKTGLAKQNFAKALVFASGPKAKAVSVFRKADSSLKDSLKASKAFVTYHDTKSTKVCSTGFQSFATPAKAAKAAKATKATKKVLKKKPGLKVKLLHKAAFANKLALKKPSLSFSQLGGKKSFSQVKLAKSKVNKKIFKNESGFDKDDKDDFINKPSVCESEMALIIKELKKIAFLNAKDFISQSLNIKDKQPLNIDENIDEKMACALSSLEYKKTKDQISLKFKFLDKLNALKILASLNTKQNFQATQNDEIKPKAGKVIINFSD